VSRFRFIDDHRDVYDVKRLCRLAEVSRSGFYAWTSRPPSPRAVADAELFVEIERIHVDSRRTYGAPRLHGQLRRRGVHLGAKRVARLMRANGRPRRGEPAPQVASRPPRHRPGTGPVAPRLPSRTTEPALGR